MTNTTKDIVQEFIEKFVEPTIPGTLGAIQIERVREWLLPALQQSYESGKEEGRRGERERCTKIMGSHESPHTESNCRLCKILSLTQE